MEISAPPGFCNLADAIDKIGQNVNIMGVVSDYLPPGKSKGTDWMFTFTLADERLGLMDTVGSDGLKVRFFAPIPGNLPKIQSKGDVVLLRKLKMTEWAGVCMAVSHYYTSWTIFPAKTIPKNSAQIPKQVDHIVSKGAPRPSVDEIKYAVDLCDFHRGKAHAGASANLVVPNNSSEALKHQTSNRDKFSLVRDVAEMKYFDLVGEVVKKYYYKDEKLDLYFTDYTPNNDLFYYEWGKAGVGDEDGEEARDGDAHGYIPKPDKTTKQWPGPFGKLTLPITLWAPHSYYAKDQVQEGDCVSIRNVHVRRDINGRLVSSLHYDKREPNRIDIKVIPVSAFSNVKDNPQLSALSERKQSYAEKFDKQASALIEEARGAQEPQPVVGNLSKTQLKKQKKAAKRLAEQENQNLDLPNKRLRPEDPTPVGDSAGPANALPKQILNPNVRCGHHSIRLLPLSSVVSLDHHKNKTPAGAEYTLPFHNLKTRTRVRVVDFFPSDLRNFSVPANPLQSSYSSSQHYGVPDSDNDEQRGAWVWRFALVLSDASKTSTSSSEKPATLTVYVADADAEHLLKLDARDLHHSDQALATLKERLFLLWGDLEERKLEEAKRKVDGGDNPKGDAGPDGTSSALEVNQQKGRPFECCLREYGVQVPMDTDSMADEDEDEESIGQGEGWRWERRWRIFGCTIV